MTFTFCCINYIINHTYIITGHTLVHLDLSPFHMISVQHPAFHHGPKHCATLRNIAQKTLRTCDVLNCDCNPLRIRCKIERLKQRITAAIEDITPAVAQCFPCHSGTLDAVPRWCQRGSYLNVLKAVSWYNICLIYYLIYGKKCYYRYYLNYFA